MTSTVDATLVQSPFAGSPARALVCRGCGAQFPLAAQHACFECFGPLEVGYDVEALRQVTREQIAAGPDNIWRYAPLLPVGQDPASRVTLNPGRTPLVRADALAREIGLRAPLWVKDDSANPTHSNLPGQRPNSPAKSAAQSGTVATPSAARLEETHCSAKVTPALPK